jgi:hypothetical protein
LAVVIYTGVSLAVHTLIPLKWDRLIIPVIAVAGIPMAASHVFAKKYFPLAAAICVTFGTLSYAATMFGFNPLSVSVHRPGVYGFFLPYQYGDLKEKETVDTLERMIRGPWRRVGVVPSLENPARTFPNRIGFEAFRRDPNWSIESVDGPIGFGRMVRGYFECLVFLEGATPVSLPGWVSTSFEIRDWLGPESEKANRFLRTSRLMRDLYFRQESIFTEDGTFHVWCQ